MHDVKNLKLFIPPDIKYVSSNFKLATLLAKLSILYSRVISNSYYSNNYLAIATPL